MNRKDFKPSYIDLCISGELAKRAARLESRLEKCDICPRNCGVNRLRGEMGYCNSIVLILGKNRLFRGVEVREPSFLATAIWRVPTARITR